MTTRQQSQSTHPWEGSAPSVWTLDAAQSTFTFRVKHFWGLMTVQGHFTQAAGEATLDAGGAVAVRLEIDAASLDTKHRQRDKHLRSEDFFHIAQHPTVTFEARACRAPPNPLEARADLLFGQSRGADSTTNVRSVPVHHRVHPPPRATYPRARC